MTDRERDLIRFIERRVLKNRGPRIRATTPLFRHRLVDSMNVLYLIGYVEHALGRQLRDQEIVMSNFDSVRAIVKAFLP